MADPAADAAYCIATAQFSQTSGWRQKGPKRQRGQPELRSSWHPASHSGDPVRPPASGHPWS